jgi:GSCFA family
MKAFRTIVQPEKAPFTLSHADRIISIGSCFSENMGKKFAQYKFPININPFGQQYNPQSIASAMERLLKPIPYTENDLTHHDELYHSFDHHGSFSGPAITGTLNNINDNLQRAANDLQQATAMFITFGTAHFFRLKQSGRVVSNCHKLSASFFERDLLNPAGIVAAFENALAKILQINPGIKLIFTVSPVRYFAFGHYENSVSKAHLFTAIYELQKRLPQIYYFPAYELVMDDLRDYRFFADDMLHPSYAATDYVWENLCRALLDKKTTYLLKEIDEILLAAKHRPRNPHSDAHRAFVQKTIDKIDLLMQIHGIGFEEEKNNLKKGLL